MATNNPAKVEKECNALLEGKVIKTQDELNRWLIVQIKKLSRTAQARAIDSKQIRKQIKIVDHFSKGGL